MWLIYYKMINMAINLANEFFEYRECFCLFFINLHFIQTSQMN